MGPGQLARLTRHTEDYGHATYRAYRDTDPIGAIYECNCSPVPVGGRGPSWRPHRRRFSRVRGRPVIALVGAMAVAVVLLWALRDHRSDDPRLRHPSTGGAGRPNPPAQPCHVRRVRRECDR